jgi:site-specific recombinase XerD
MLIFLGLGYIFIPSKLLEGIMVDYQSYIVRRRAERGICKESIRNITGALADFDRFVGKPVEQITTADIEAYLTNLRKQGIRPSTIHTKIGYVKTFMAFCHREKIIESNPFANIKIAPPPEAEQQFIPLAELRESLLAVCGNDRDRLLVLLLSYTGMRACEAARLTWGDISEDYSRLKVHGKGDKWRYIPINTKLKKVLAPLRNGHPKVIAQINNPHMGVNAQFVSVRIRELAKKAGLRGIGSHSFRRALITDLVSKTANIKPISKIAGHSNVTTTARYMGFSFATRSEIMELAD